MASTQGISRSTVFGKLAVVLLIVLNVAALLATLVARYVLMGFLEQMGAHPPRLTATVLELWYPCLFGAFAICAVLAGTLSSSREQRGWLLLAVQTASWATLLYFPVAISALLLTFHDSTLA